MHLRLIVKRVTGNSHAARIDTVRESTERPTKMLKTAALTLAVTMR